jgi:agmatinase
VKRIIRNLAGLNIVGADIVEVSPAYDTNAELTAMAAADLALEFLALMTADRAQPASKGGVLNAALREHVADGRKKGKSPVGFTNLAGAGAQRDIRDEL